MPVNSELINLIESELLGITFNVNDDEDILMADDLLDLELDTVILGQSTRNPLVSRVPYKSCDPQTSNSRSLLELCCKDPSRSNNNSTFVDDALAPISPGMPSLEMAWGTHSTHHLIWEATT